MTDILEITAGKFQNSCGNALDTIQYHSKFQIS